MELRYIGSYQPKGMIVDVDDGLIEDLLLSKEYERVTAIKIKKVVEVKEDDSVFG